ncbi:MAG: single-stranded DNA-binding protein [Anaerolineae bacterium]
MTRGLNKVMLIGRVEGELELRHTPSGRSVTSFGVATPRQWTSVDGEQHQEMEWFNVVAWGSLADICHKKIAEGSQVYIEGRLQTRGWEDNAGKRHFRTEVVAQEIIVLSNE